MGWDGMGEGQPLTQTARSPGDRTSGFSGLSTQGPPGLYPGAGLGEDHGFPGGGAVARPFLPPASLLAAGTPVGGLLGALGVEEQLRAGRAPDSFRQCPEGQDPLAACSRGVHKVRSILRLPKLLGGASILVSVSVICLSVLLTQGQGWVCHISGSEPHVPPCPGFACSLAGESSLASLREIKDHQESLIPSSPRQDLSRDILFPTQVHSSQIHPVKTPITLAKLI